MIRTRTTTTASTTINAIGVDVPVAAAGELGGEICREREARITEAAEGRSRREEKGEGISKVRRSTGVRVSTGAVTKAVERRGTGAIYTDGAEQSRAKQGRAGEPPELARPPCRRRRNSVLVELSGVTLLGQRLMIACQTYYLAVNGTVFRAV